jgi:hypothetical protein
MARLNPKNVRFDVGSGGIPELTSTDIAAALAMVPAGIGRELLCRVWWPDGANLTARQLAAQMEHAQRAEWAERETRMLHATLAVAVHTGGESLRRAQRQYSEAHAARWPRWVADAEIGTLSPGYSRVRAAVLTELCSPGLCPTCSGRGHRVDDYGVHVSCAGCKGSGRRAISDRWRAEALQITEAGYRHTWRGAYEWMYQLCADAITSATRAMDTALA